MGKSSLKDLLSKLRYTDKFSDSSHQPKDTLVNTVDKLPVGEIRLVPKDFYASGYIDYVPGKRYDSNMFNALYKLLGTDTFPEINTQTGITPLPLGSIIYSLTDTDIPDGYIKWEYSPGNLDGTDLIKVMEEVALRMPASSPYYQKWSVAVSNNTFPEVTKDFFFKVISGVLSAPVGEYTEETYNMNHFVEKHVDVFPGVYMSQTYNDTLGVKGRMSAIVNTSGEFKKLSGITKALVGVDLEHRLSESIDYTTETLSPLEVQHRNLSELAKKGTSTEPANIAVFALVKVNKDTTKLSENFKYIIKAYDTLDVKYENVELQLSNMVNFYNDTHTNIEKYKKQADDLSQQIQALKTSFSDEVLHSLNDKVNAFVESTKQTLIDSINSAEPKLRDITASKFDLFKKELDNCLIKLDKEYQEKFEALCCLAKNAEDAVDPVLKLLNSIHKEVRESASEIVEKVFADSRDKINAKVEAEVNTILQDINKIKKDLEAKLASLVEEKNGLLSSIEEQKESLLDLRPKLEALESKLNQKVSELSESIDTQKQALEAQKQKEIADIADLVRAYTTADTLLDTKIGVNTSEILKLKQSTENLEERFALVEMRKQVKPAGNATPYLIENVSLPTKRYGNRDIGLAAPDAWYQVEEGKLIPVYFAK